MVDLASLIRMVGPMDLRWRLSHARGYLELGMWREAEAELDAVGGAAAKKLEVLALRVAVLHEKRDWVQLCRVAATLVERQPDEPGWWVSFAFATRRSQSLRAAQAILLQSEERHPDSAIIQFNLGCYACQLGELVDAQRRIARAIALDSNFRAVAKTDPDLEPLRESDATDFGL